MTCKENIFYHVCRGSSLTSILERGLIPSIGRNSENAGEATPAVFLFTSRLACEDALQNWLGELFDDDEQLYVLEIMLPENFPVISDVEYEIKTECTISSECIIEVLDERFIPVRDRGLLHLQKSAHPLLCRRNAKI